jgi:hypothetical protein
MHGSLEYLGGQSVGSYKLFQENKQDAVVGWVTGLRSVFEHFKEMWAWRDIVMILAKFQR